VTDAYLAGLARHHGGKLASFGRGLVALHPDVGVGLAA
jgi:predicted nucleic acid-binding protein